MADPTTALSYEVVGGTPRQRTAAGKDCATVLHWLSHWSDLLTSAFRQPPSLRFDVDGTGAAAEGTTLTVGLRDLDGGPAALLLAVLTAVDRDLVPTQRRVPALEVPRNRRRTDVDDPDIAFLSHDELVLTVNLTGTDLHAVDDRLGELLDGVADLADMHGGPTAGRWILLPP
ncbi:hypothetical protein ACFPIJ_31970 [Dactylosporangium cerinum]|uniref:Uncharacterized protein n=1 Tax=Dactylosporangium cerinum TaxID=1434730 RepID=A0ABV9W390_9ACTN